MLPTPSQIGQLAQRSGSLFIYAATLSVLSLTAESTKKHAEIDVLYTAILRSALEEAQMEEHEAEDVKLVLRTVLFAQEPISVETIAVLAGLDSPQRVYFALQLLRSVLHQSEDTKLVSTLHASFPDVMLSSDRSEPFFCYIVNHSKRLAERCLAVMKDQLEFNICKLESSFVPDDKVEDRGGRIKQPISPTLAYAFRYWVNHLTLAPRSDALLKWTRAVM
ncbi:vegetative incompatibility protein HET-E-1, partial [Rhizoctonia solani AG-3 Rhs1AP]